MSKGGRYVLELSDELRDVYKAELAVMSEVDRRLIRCLEAKLKEIGLKIIENIFPDTKVDDFKIHIGSDIFVSYQEKYDIPTLLNGLFTVIDEYPVVFLNNNLFYEREGYYFSDLSKIVSKTLLHELTHVVQYEKAGRDDLKAFGSDDDDTPYEERPHEIEARRISGEYKKKYRYEIERIMHECQRVALLK